MHFVGLLIPENFILRCKSPYSNLDPCNYEIVRRKPQGKTKNTHWVMW